MTLQVPCSECIFLLIRSNGEGEGDGEGHGVSGLLILHARHPLCSHKHFAFAFALLTTTDATDTTPHTYSF